MPIVCAAALSLLVILHPAFAFVDSPAPVFAHDRQELARLIPDAAIGSPPGGCLIVSPAAYTPAVPAVDPEFHWSFSRALYVYAPRSEESVRGLYRIATVHFTPELAAQAERSGCLIARLWALHRDHFKREIVFPSQAESADIYLASESPAVGGDVGGQTHNGKIYIFGAGVVDRSPLEWVRTLTHEWGHLTLPAARGFAEPENDAAGYLGERLYLKWLRTDESARPPSAPDDGATVADLDLYYHRQIGPLIREFEAAGPASPLLDHVDTEAMDYYIGSVLATDDAYGSPTTGRALYTVLADHPRDFLAALRRNLADKSTISIHPPAWVPLAAGRWTVQSPAGFRLSARPIEVKQTVWRRFAADSGADTDPSADSAPDPAPGLAITLRRREAAAAP